MTRFAFSCVVDDDPVLVGQAAIWLTCLRERQRIRPDDIFVHATALRDAGFLDELRRQGVNVVEIARFDRNSPHCNKIMQLATFARCDYDQIVLMDCDTAWIGDRALPCGEPVAAVVVHEPNPPLAVLTEIFAEAGLGAPEPTRASFAATDAEVTDANNCNGGLYIIRQDFIATLETTWRRWAEWSLRHVAIFRSPDLAFHIDQVSFALAMREAGVRVRHLDAVWNYPTSLPANRSPDMAPQILHYHRRFTADGRIDAIGRPRVDAAVASLNALIAGMETDPGLGRILADCRSALPDPGPSVAAPAGIDPALISTIVLNWNRAPLLRQCLQSYAETVTGPAEIVVVDNASTDESREIIAAARAFLPRLRSVLLDQNIGGEAVNSCLDTAAGELIHISENDQLFLPGWADHVRIAFDRYPDLGRLSLFSPVPTDREAWHAKRGRLRFSRGKILYEAEGYPGTSSVLRATLIRDHLIRLRNRAPREGSDFKLPDDRRLNDDVQRAGFWNGWSDRYYVRNIGHELAEFRRDRAYYESNAAAKPDFGIAGWERNMADAFERPPVRRHSVVFPEAADAVQPEITTPDARGKPARLWSMFDAFTAEIEVLDFLYALTRMIKPRRILETGTWIGRSAIAFASGLRDNGFGHLDTLELNPEAADAAGANIAAAGLSLLVGIHRGSSLEFHAGEPYEMALFDSDIPLRVGEFQRFYPWLEPGAVVLFHDTAEHRAGAADGVRDLITMGMLEGSFFETPRGIFVGRAVKPARPQSGGMLNSVPYGFSPQAYLDANPDLASAGIDPAEHYREYGWAERRQLAPDWSLPGIRLILTVTTGRSGTDYLSQLLGAVPGICSVHEAEPDFAAAMRPAQRDPAAARRFWEVEKLPAIRRCGQPVYVETSHLACKGFIEPLVEQGCIPDLIILRRSPYLVATSLFALDTIPGRTWRGQRYLLQPDDPGVLPLDGWRELPDWALCFWYCREIERRMAVYGAVVRERGGRVIDTSVRRLQSDQGAGELLEFVGAEAAILADPEFIGRRAAVTNQKLDAKATANRVLSGPEMIDLAREVDARLQRA